MFAGRRLLIATKHGKEQVIAPLLEEALSVTCFTDPTFDTDSLGTFTGEVERVLDPVSTLKEKCRRAMEASGCDLAVASEGSFGAHPSYFWASADDELLVLMDAANGLEVTARELSLSTNFDAAEVTDLSELHAFASKAGFPSHGLILRPTRDDRQVIEKGVMDHDTLERVFTAMIAGRDSVHVETDMRAMCNPTRMAVIGKAAEKLVARLKAACPECSMPGFVVTEVVAGLQCSLCGAPTRSVRSVIRQCQRCQHREEELFPEKKTEEDPMYCDYCNP